MGLGLFIPTICSAKEDSTACWMYLARCSSKISATQLHYHKIVSPHLIYLLYVVQLGLSIISYDLIYPTDLGNVKTFSGNIHQYVRGDDHLHADTCTLRGLIIKYAQWSCYAMKLEIGWMI